MNPREKIIKQFWEAFAETDFDLAAADAEDIATPLAATDTASDGAAATEVAIIGAVLMIVS